MATSYQAFWLIVGMTATAVVIANATSTKRHPSNYTTSSKSNEALSPVFSSKPTASADQLVSAPGRPVPPASKPASSPATDTPPIAVTRSIDQDIRSAFDEAMKVALAVPRPKVIEMIEDGDEPATKLSPLETKEVSSTPKIFDEPAPAIVGNGGSAREKVRTLTDLNLREGPDAAYVKIETLANDTLLFVLEKNGKWWRVKSTTTGVEGWINGTFVKPVD